MRSAVGPRGMRLRAPGGPTREVLGVPVQGGPAPPPWDGAIRTEHFCADASRLRMQQGPCVLYVADGNEVVLEAPDRPTRLEYDFLAYASASRVLLWQRQRFNLHATLVVSPGGSALAITGHSHAGKSTTTIELVRRGWRFACDDIVEVDLSGGDARAVPFARPIHLSDQAARLAGADSALGRPLPWRGKKVYDTTADLAPRPLTALVHLTVHEGGGEPRVASHAGLSGLPLLAHLSDPAGVCQLPDHRDAYLAWSLGLARAVPMVQVSRPADADTVSGVADAIERSLSPSGRSTSGAS